jgi:hypothetical protein
MRLTPFREPARLLFHLSDGHTQVLLVRTEGVGMADGGAEWAIRTAVIPPHLRGIGSEFLLVGQFVTPEAQDKGDELRAALRALRVEELGRGDCQPARGATDQPTPSLAGCGRRGAIVGALAFGAAEAACGAAGLIRLEYSTAPAWVHALGVALPAAFFGSVAGAVVGSAVGFIVRHFWPPACP